MNEFELKMMGGDKFLISKNEFQLFSGKTGLIYIPSLSGLINISSISHILPIGMVNNNRKQNSDGQWCIQKFGQWYLEGDPDIRVNTNYYPELLEQPEKKELPSEFAKQLSKTI